MIDQNPTFEIVHTCPDWYDGPREGIADYQGQPHLFVSDYGDFSGRKNLYSLSPINEETFLLAKEDWAIWLRWNVAFHKGQVAQDTHPALPDERDRHEELKRLLEDRLVLDPAHTFRRDAEFRNRQDASWSGLGFSPLEVCWRELDTI